MDQGWKGQWVSLVGSVTTGLGTRNFLLVHSSFVWLFTSCTLAHSQAVQVHNLIQTGSTLLSIFCITRRACRSQRCQSQELGFIIILKWSWIAGAFEMDKLFMEKMHFKDSFRNENLRGEISEECIPGRWTICTRVCLFQGRFLCCTGDSGNLCETLQAWRKGL